MRRWFTSAFLSLSTTATKALRVVRPTTTAQSCWTTNTRSAAAPRGRSTVTSRLLSVRAGSQEYTVLSDPAPGSPFHYAFPVHDLALAKEFYGSVLGCQEGRSSEKWQDYSLHGHQIVAHWAGDNYRCQDYYNPVDGDEVPVPRK